VGGAIEKFFSLLAVPSSLRFSEESLDALAARSAAEYAST
jgi:hypothetical protein